MVTTVDPETPDVHRTHRFPRVHAGARRGVAATTAASTGVALTGRVRASTLAASVRVAPLVATSSTTTSSPPDGAAASGTNVPARFARRCATDSPAESRT